MSRKGDSSNFISDPFWQHTKITLSTLPHSKLESLAGPREDAEHSTVLMNCFYKDVTLKLSIPLPTLCPEE